MNGARLIADNGRKLGSYCVIGEPTGLVPIRQHKGNLTMSVEYVGQSGHARLDSVACTIDPRKRSPRVQTTETL